MFILYLWNVNSVLEYSKLKLSLKGKLVFIYLHTVSIFRYETYSLLLVVFVWIYPHVNVTADLQAFGS